MNFLPPADEMYRAMVERDDSFEGLFYACLRTTGIFCRPTCSARKPKPEHVEFAASVHDALQRGYRPCRVCDPLAVTDADPKWLGPLIDEIKGVADAPLTDADLRSRGLDPVLVRRTFKWRFGMTIQAYERAHRLGRAVKSLHAGVSTLDVAFEAGIESESGFRDAFARVFGDVPGPARDAARLRATWIETPLGPMLAIAGDEGLQLLEFVDGRTLETELTRLRGTLGRAIVLGDHPMLTQTAMQLREYFAGARQQFEIPLRQHGSPFQRRVWSALCEIPYGETRSYGDIANRVGSPAAVRAVGTTNGQNQIAIVVPCHRVIRSDGSLCGYGGGRWRKQWLLDHERAPQVR